MSRVMIKFQLKTQSYFCTIFNLTTFIISMLTTKTITSFKKYQRHCTNFFIVTLSFVRGEKWKKIGGKRKLFRNCLISFCSLFCSIFHQGLLRDYKIYYYSIFLCAFCKIGFQRIVRIQFRCLTSVFNYRSIRRALKSGLCRSSLPSM